MRLGIDAREIQEGVHTGIGRPLANFLYYFSKLDQNDTCILFSSKTIPIDFGPRVKNVVIPEHSTFIWDQILLSKALKNAAVDVFYSPYYKVPLLAKCKIVSTIYDLMYLVFNEYKNTMRIDKKLYYKIFQRLYINKADYILTCSEHSKKDIIKIFNIDENKIILIPLSLSDIYRVPNNPVKIDACKRKYKIDGPYILYLGNFRAHKNVKSIVLAFHQVLQKHPGLKLVLAGPKNYTYPQIEQLVNRLNLNSSVIFTGQINPDDEPAFLYAGAEAFVFPSLYEGFGLPPLEAMACGTPVVASNCTSMPEVVNDAGLLINPNNFEEIRDAIARILDDDKLKSMLIEKGLKIAQKYRSDNIAKITYDFFNKLI